MVAGVRGDLYHFDVESGDPANTGTRSASLASPKLSAILGPWKGFEWSNVYTPTPWLTLDADFAYSKARFRDDDPAGDRIPGAARVSPRRG